MPNPNYLAGRAVEYEVIRLAKLDGWDAVRTAGSHGPFDVISFRPDRKPIFTQCKRVGNQTTANRLIKKFRENTQSSLYYHQAITIKIKGSTDLLTAVV